MAKNAGRPGTRRAWLRTAVAVSAVALGTFGAQANAVPGTASHTPGTAVGAASTAVTARAATPWQLRLPMSETVSTEFWDIASTGAKDTWAVGRKTDGADGATPAIRHWNGAKWTDVAAASTGGKAAQLEKVAAAAPDDVWAAGSLTDSASAPLVLQHWDGKKWTKVDHAAPAEGAMSFVADIATFGKKAAWLTSFDWNPASDASEFRLERWTGSAWQKVSLPPRPAVARWSPGTSPAPARTTSGSPPPP